VSFLAIPPDFCPLLVKMPGHREEIYDVSIVPHLDDAGVVWEFTPTIR
jgi:hypothetical protein